tara:strand:- start:1347 stop:2075 length:729 start_codon:yes stop_codon:yes gene_type:complete
VLNKLHGLAKSSVIYGKHAVEEALENGVSIHRILLTDSNKYLLQHIKNYGVPYSFVPPEALNRYSSGNHQGVLALLPAVEYKQWDEVLINSEGEKRVLLLDGITDVRNFGAIARTAKSFDFDLIVVPKSESAFLNGDAIKTSAGALLSLPVARVNHLKDCIYGLKEMGIGIYGLNEKGNDDFSKISHKSCALILGNEQKGIQSGILKLCDAQIRIPMSISFNSLNVSVAAGIGMYEINKKAK